MINNNLDLTNNIYFKKQITNQKFDKQPLKNTIKNICKDLTHKTNPETSLEKLCTFVENVNSERKNHYTPGNSSRRQLGDPSKLTIDEIFTNGEPSLDTIFNGSIVIGNNTQSDSEYKTFSYTLKNILLYLYENTPEFKTAIDYMNETSRNKMPWKPKYNGIIYNLDNSSRKGAGSISSWKGARGHGYRDSIRTDAQPAEGAPFYMFLSLTKGFSINENFDIETIFHEFAHACQFAAGNAAPFTNTFVNLSSEKSIGAFVNEFETTGSLKGPSPYSEMSFSQSFQP